MSDSTTIEVASVGSEGVVGVRALGELGPEAYLQVSHGTLQYMALNVFDALCVHSELGRAVDQFCGTFMQSVMQLVACNRLHPMEARCARWLLLTHERLGRARFELTQQFLAMAIAAAPGALADFMARLAQQGIVKHDGGTVTVLDAIALRRQACGCYAVLKKNTAYARVPPGPPKTPSANVVRMRPSTVCTLCGLTRDYPHKTHAECLHALDSDLRSLIGRAKDLSKMRKQIATESMERFDKLLNRRRS